MNTHHSESLPNAGFFKRLLSMFYDGLLLLAAIFIASFALLPFKSLQFGGSLFILQYFYVIGICFMYFAWSWKRGGQTLGLKSWKLQVVSADGSELTWQQIIIRFIASWICWIPLGLGYLWILLNKQKLAWNDILSNTRVVKKPLDDTL